MVAIGKTEQIENKLSYIISSKKAKRTSNKKDKQIKNRHERRRANINPECEPFYGKYYGWEY